MKDVTNKVLTHCMGVYDLFYGEFDNRTKPLVKKLEKTSSNKEEFIDALLASPIFNIQVIFTTTKEEWDVLREPFMLFMASRTHWNFLFEGVMHYIERTEVNGKLSDIMFVKHELSDQRKHEIRQWLLDG